MDWYKPVLNCMELHTQQEVAKEREKAKKLVEALEYARSVFNTYGLLNDRDFVNKSLTEYEKL